MIIEITSNGSILGLIIPGSHRRGEGTQFYTPGDHTLQVANIHRHGGQVIEPHVHNPVPRRITQTQEVFIVGEGKMRVDFYDQDRSYVESRILNKGDVYILIDGGHAFQALEETRMIEVKQGPYVGEGDKTHFTGLPADQTIIKE